MGVIWLEDQLKGPKDLLTPEDLKKYETSEYPFSLTVLHEALKVRLKEEPGFEMWVPLRYHKLASHLGGVNEITEYTPHKVYISNQGRVLSFRRKTPKLLSSFLDEGYHSISLDTDGMKRRGLVVHRALACNFIGISKALGPIHPKHLHVNHIDGVKGNLELSNLEWTTSQGNFIHALERGIHVPPSGLSRKNTKPIKGTVVKGDRVGYEFIVAGVKQMAELGLADDKVYDCCYGKRLTHRKCSWSFASDEEVKTLASNEPYIQEGR